MLAPWDNHVILGRSIAIALASAIHSAGIKRDRIELLRQLLYRR